jgi:tyrosyl-tRNA synthetase
MMAKDSVKNRIVSDDSAGGSEGMSFTEFTYQLVQGYDFLHLYKNNNCSLQMGGSDQWGNITTGTELVRRMAQGKAYAITCPLITKADGSKFGKSEGGNVWLDPQRTSPYKFYQYWLNSSDEDSEKYIKIFTFLDEKTIEELIAEHTEAPHMRLLQKRLASEMTQMVHSQEALDKAIQASNILFGKSTSDDLKQLDEQTFLDVFSGVPQAEVNMSVLDGGYDLVAALSADTGFLKSNSDVMRALKQNAISVNKEKVKVGDRLGKEDLIKGKFILLQRGKKNYFVLYLV